MTRYAQGAGGQVTRWGLWTGSVQRHYDPVSKYTVKLYAHNRGDMDEPDYIYIVEEIDKKGTTTQHEIGELREARRKFKEAKRAHKVNISGIYQ